MKKRLVSLMAAVIFALSFTGCSNAGDEINLSQIQQELARLTNRIVFAMAELLENNCGSEGPAVPEPVPAKPFRVETSFERHEDRPEDAKIDMLLPRIYGSSTAETINTLIEKDFSAEKTMSLEDLMENGFGYYYPWLNIHYKTVEINGLWSVNIFTEYSSAAGSGILTLVSRYYYDWTEDRYLTEEMYLENLGILKDDVVAAYYMALGGIPEDDDFRVTYGDVKMIYYIEENEEIVVFIRQ